jgi:hypothetical protein
LSLIASFSKCLSYLMQLSVANLTLIFYCLLVKKLIKLSIVMKSVIHKSPSVDLEKVIHKGRGGSVNNKPGNLDYRYLAGLHRDAYQSSTDKKSKRNIITAICDTLIDNGYTLSGEGKEPITAKDTLKEELGRKTSQLLREKEVNKVNPNNLEVVLKMSKEVTQSLSAIGKAGAKSVESKVKNGTKRVAEKEDSWVSKVSPVAKRTRSLSDSDKKASDMTTSEVIAEDKLYNGNLSYAANQKMTQQPKSSNDRTFYESQDDGWADRVKSPVPFEQAEEVFDLYDRTEGDKSILKYAKLSDVGDLDKNQNEWAKRLYEGFGGDSKELG